MLASSKSLFPNPDRDLMLPDRRWHCYCNEDLKIHVLMQFSKSSFRKLFSWKMGKGCTRLPCCCGQAELVGKVGLCQNALGHLSTDIMNNHVNKQHLRGTKFLCS